MGHRTAPRIKNKPLSIKVHPMRRKLRILFIVLLAPALLGSVLWGMVFLWNRLKPRIPVTIARDTTYITTVDADGTPKFAHEYFKRAFTKSGLAANSDNKLVRIRLLSSAPMADQVEWLEHARSTAPAEPIFLAELDTFADLLDNPGLMDDGLSDAQKVFLKQDPADVMASATSAAWQSKSRPVLTEWLHRNQPALTWLAAIPLGTTVADPKPSGIDAVMAWPMDSIQLLSYSCKVFLCRAMQRTGGGRRDDALKDLKTVIRITDLIASHPGTLALLYVATIRCETAVATQALALASKDDVMLERLAGGYLNPHVGVNLPRMVDDDERIGFQQVLWKLGALDAKEAKQFADDFGVGYFSDIAGIGNHDWNLAMRQFNDRIDAVVFQLQHVDPVVRNENLEALETEVRMSRAAGIKAGRRALLLGASPSGKVSGDVMAAFVLPALQNVTIAVDRMHAADMTTQLVIAIRRFYIANRSLPNSLQELVPQYIDELPINPATKQPPTFIPDGDEFTIINPVYFSDGKTFEDSETHFRCKF